MVKYELTYEEIRLKMIEHNKKIIMELKLTKHAQDLRDSSSGLEHALKPSSAKPRTKRVKVESSEVRKSIRAKNPSPRYKEVYIIRAYDRANRDSGSIGKENSVEVNKKPEENVLEATKLRGSSKRKRGGR